MTGLGENRKGKGALHGGVGQRRLLRGSALQSRPLQQETRTLWGSIGNILQAANHREKSCTSTLPGDHQHIWECFGKTCGSFDNCFITKLIFVVIFGTSVKLLSSRYSRWGDDAQIWCLCTVAQSPFDPNSNWSLNIFWKKTCFGRPIEFHIPLYSKLIFGCD